LAPGVFDDAVEWANKTLDLNPRHPHAASTLLGVLEKG
jgi:hypothetical protein